MRIWVGIRNPVQFERILNRFLRRVISHQLSEVFPGFGRQQAPVKKLSVTHPSARRADDHQFGFSSLGGFTSFPQRQGSPSGRPDATDLETRPDGNASFSQSSGIWPAVLHRVFVTSKLSTGADAILPSHSERRLVFESASQAVRLPPAPSREHDLVCRYPACWAYSPAPVPQVNEKESTGTCHSSLAPAHFGTRLHPWVPLLDHSDPPDYSMEALSLDDVERPPMEMPNLR